MKRSLYGLKENYSRDTVTFNRQKIYTQTKIAKILAIRYTKIAKPNFIRFCPCMKVELMHLRVFVFNSRRNWFQFFNLFSGVTDFVPNRFRPTWNFDRFRPTQISSCTDFVPFFSVETDFIPFLTDFVPNDYYNVVSYVHIPLVP